MFASVLQFSDSILKLPMLIQLSPFEIAAIAAVCTPVEPLKISVYVQNPKSTTLVMEASWAKYLKFIVFYDWILKLSVNNE